MKMRIRFLSIFMLALLMGACKGDDDSNGDDNTPDDNETVKLANNGDFGSILVDQEGMTLYYFSLDSKGESLCNGDCLDAWPVFYEPELTLGEGLERSDFGTITRGDGEMQTTYKGWPLYYFANDNDAGDVQGDGAGDVWYVAKPDYSIMVVRAQLVGRDRDGNETNLTGDYEEGDEQTFYMVDAEGNTLYLFINDTNGKNNFTAEDFSNNSVWPIFEETLERVPSYFDRDDFGSIDVFGRKQLTYKGWPLYFFGQDENRGDNFGVGFPAPGIWPIANNDTEVAPQPAVSLSHDDDLGNILVDAEGMTLYYFSLDADGSSRCEGGCLENWPIFHEERLTLGEGLDSDDFDTITREDGQMQTTYKGWPLYYFVNDNNAGDVNGEAVGNVWFVAKPDYSVMYVRSQLVGRDRDGNETNLTGEYEPGDEETFYLVDEEGRTLYLFINDTNGKNNFTAEDFSNNSVWPIFEETLENVPSIFNKDDFGSIDVFGRKQLTYKGWPMYYFVQDEMRGDNFGVGFPSPGIWPILNLDTEVAPEAAPEGATFNVTNQAASSYIFNGGGFSNTEDPDLTLKRGATYEFNVQAPGHPFFIKTTQSLGTGDTYDNGVQNNGASTMTITFQVPNDAPATLYYICEFHAEMVGTINIVD